MLITILVLKLLDFSSFFIIETDAKWNNNRGGLSSTWWFFAYLTKPFPPTILRSSTYTKEICAVVEAIHKYRHYLLGRKFFIFTSLLHLLMQSVHTLEQEKWIRHLLSYNFVIKYWPGRSNAASDVLSRHLHDDPPTLAIISFPATDILC